MSRASQSMRKSTSHVTEAEHTPRGFGEDSGVGTSYLEPRKIITNKLSHVIYKTHTIARRIVVYFHRHNLFAAINTI